ncbi:carboxyl transferase domain-containing protein [Marinobacter adhaerens]|jgi:acetyl/propionyl-CoA carboxylase alpha subunit/acetyl-CoA carboxylase carboxyltransferase component|uniref:Carbamoyl-phosphate synthase large subunit n=2 Tax=Marinobacter adhaerens TaxID=1033846 RepID=A0ABX8ILW7_9GAMM|nr:carboxyl transferase domain-containing protein [Marinobacter adhaerens]ADP98514.1 protein containing carbamoyl phosphate synthetase, large subunit, ATP-binding / carboxyl transferase / carbamoyl phosphate synthase, large subunit, N-terminal / biotin carboxylase, C-terminal / biotin/lipoyl attachment [Marinobacter adhaerens HP15]MBW4976976.1 carbamoyl-phosphate synthase large subunit [Marinobacter adhaerens]QWV12512.1 carbamoyl-phosphate synthase large subunit [Marinobacter adhaerens]
MTFRSVLIANRGEIAIRIARACSELGLRSVAVFSEDDDASLHTRMADEAVALTGHGVKAYLDGAQLIDVAKAHGCEAIHPGYGFLAENAGFARSCEQAGLIFIGPSPDVLEGFGDKSAARALAERCEVPLIKGINRSVNLTEARAFLDEHGPLMIKAIAGGGGRGMRAVHAATELDQAFQRCQSEAQAAFGNGSLYVEQLIARARHIEIQIVGDGTGAVSHLWERDCSLQRRNQKLIEIAPSPLLDASIRDAMIDSALKLAGAVNYRGLGTFEFLVDEDHPGHFYFMEANPRIQVEHTITEEITGVDLVQTQLQLFGGLSLTDLALESAPHVRGFAIQARINSETLHADGHATAATGTLSTYEPPSGPGLRVDGYGYAGYTISPSFDSLLAKLVAHGSDYPSTLRRLYRALCEFRLTGVSSNIGLLQNLVRHSGVETWAVTTRFVEDNLKHLIPEATKTAHPHLHFGNASASAVEESPGATAAPAGTIGIEAPSSGTVVSIDVTPGDSVAIGDPIAVLEAMKMEFVVTATNSGIIHTVVAEPGTMVNDGQALVYLEPADVEAGGIQNEETVDLEYIRADLAEVLERHNLLTDQRRPGAVAKRRKTAQRTARENVEDLLDPDSFNEYGALALAAQRRRRSADKLAEMSPADGLITAIGTVNAPEFGPETGRCATMAYDYTVFAGTQGLTNHRKADRILALAEQWRIPLVLFAEGGGGRPSDTDANGVSFLDCHTFVGMARLSGVVPTLGIVSGRCYAGNAALLGCCDTIIATRDANLGMAGPAMIEGGGLGRFSPEQVGPVSVMGPNGVIDVLVEDETEAVSVAKKYLSYFQGTLEDWQCDDQRRLRHLIPENRMRVYDIRQVIETLADQDSVLELRSQFAPGLITALVRIEGRPMGLIANNPAHLGGAVDASAGDKAARFMQLCNAHGLPILSLCDTPGFMVGPDAEKQATIRHISRMFVAAAKLNVPFFTVILRKAYGLGAQAMAAGSMLTPFFTAAWPSGEFGPMGWEGAVRLGFAKELAAQPDEESRQTMFDTLVAKAYEQGKALNVASYLEIDAVIDPQETRAWLIRGLNSTSGIQSGEGGKFVDTW